LSRGMAERSFMQDLDQLDAFIVQTVSPPSWTTPDSGITDIRNHLIITARRKSLIAIYASDPSVRELLISWIDGKIKPPFERVPKEIIQGAFVRGEAKGLWLRGTHVRRSTQPDTKNITGIKVEDTLSPLHDSSFAMSAVRMEIPEDPQNK